MKGLLYKDFAGSKKEILLAAVMCGAFMLFACLAGKSAFSAALGAIVSMSAMIPTFSLQNDKTSGWNKFICASPIPRNRVVLSKYILAPALTAALLVTGLIADLVCGTPIPLWAFLCFFAIDITFMSVMIPIAIRLGQSAVVVIFAGLVFVPVGLGMLLYRSGVISGNMLDRFLILLDAVPPELLSAAFLAVSLLLLTISYFLCCRIYRNMEF